MPDGRLWTQVGGKVRLARAPAPVRPDVASCSRELGEFVPPDEAVRWADGPDEYPLDFLQNTRPRRTRGTLERLTAG